MTTQLRACEMGLERLIPTATWSLMDIYFRILFLKSRVSSVHWITKELLISCPKYSCPVCEFFILVGLLLSQQLLKMKRMKRNSDPTLPWLWKKPLLLGAELRWEWGLLPRIPGTLSSNEQFVSQPLNHYSHLKFYPVESLQRKNTVEIELMWGIIVILTHVFGVF